MLTVTTTENELVTVMLSAVKCWGQCGLGSKIEFIDGSAMEILEAPETQITRLTTSCIGNTSSIASLSSNSRSSERR